MSLLVKMLFKVYESSLVKKEVASNEVLKREIPLYTVENIGKEYEVLGSVSSESYHKVQAENDLLKKAKELGANAIVGCTINSTSKVQGITKTSISFFIGKTVSGNTSTDTLFSFYGTAVKIKESKNSIVLDDNNIEKLILDKINEQKSLLENNIIDETEFNSRKEKLLEEMKSIKKERELNLLLDIEEASKKEKELNLDYITDIQIIKNEFNSDDFNLLSFIVNRVREGYSYNSKNNTFKNKDSSTIYKIKTFNNEYQLES